MGEYGASLLGRFASFTVIIPYIFVFFLCNAWVRFTVGTTRTFPFKGVQYIQNIGTATDNRRKRFSLALWSRNGGIPDSFLNVRFESRVFLVSSLRQINISQMGPSLLIRCSLRVDGGLRSTKKITYRYLVWNTGYVKNYPPAPPVP